ncbi:alkaline phosphatase family protein [Membranihabitans marinus]
MKMKTLYTALLLIFIAFIQPSKTEAQQVNPEASKPKLIVGVVVDQMRWDFLYRYQDRYVDGGFKRMLREGFTCENAQIDYAQTVTACGHTCVYTGSVPAIHGIAGNDWYDDVLKRTVYCAEDTVAQTIGGGKSSGYSRSPVNLWTTTIGDELKLANNFRSKVVGVSFKDRGAIFPSGHLSDGAYWFDNGSGNFVSSTYYFENLPKWVQDFNNRRLADKYLNQTWNTLYPIDTYVQSAKDNNDYENILGGKEAPVFPYDLSKLRGDSYGLLKNVPFGNSITFDIAKAAIEGENLGQGEFTDMLTVSFSTPDGLGHTVGPNAIEIEDTYLRMDKEFAEFFAYLDEKYGRDGYLFFITADHGVAQSPGFLEENKLPTGTFDKEFIKELNKAVSDKFNIDKVIEASAGYHLYLDWDKVFKSGADVDKLYDFMIYKLRQHPGIVDALVNDKLGEAAVPEILKSKLVNGYNVKRNGDITLIFMPQWKGGSRNGATHGAWYPYDAHIPLVWMGWNIEHGQTSRQVGMADIAPTLAAMLKIQMPSGNIGHPIKEIVD